MDTTDLVAPMAAEVATMTDRSISAASLGLLSTPCPDCGAGAGEWCRRRGHNINQQHTGRYTAWRAAGRPTIGADRSIAVDRTERALNEGRDGNG